MASVAMFSTRRVMRCVKLVPAVTSLLKLRVGDSLLAVAPVAKRKSKADWFAWFTVVTSEISPSVPGRVFSSLSSSKG